MVGSVLQDIPDRCVFEFLVSRAGNSHCRERENRAIGIDHQLRTPDVIAHRLGGMPIRISALDHSHGVIGNPRRAEHCSCHLGACFGGNVSAGVVVPVRLPVGGTHLGGECCSWVVY